MKFRIENPIAIFGIGGFILIAATFLNTALAFINAHGFYIGQPHVIFGEILIVLAIAFYVGMKIGAYRNILPPFLFLLAVTCTFLYVSIINESINPKAMRDMVLVVSFFMLGGLVNTGQILNTFRFITASVLLFMIIENYALDAYVTLFRPGDYFASTRGIGESEYNDTGLFIATLGYSTRFSYNFLSDHRLSSIFLEQVSLGNFAILAAIFTSCFWKSLQKGERIFYLLTIPLIIMTTSSRMASVLCFLILIGHFLFPLLPRYSHLLYMPFMIFIGFLAFYDPNLGPVITSDDFHGRVSHTIYLLSILDKGYFTGGTAADITKTGDSGYTYFILMQTILGLIAFWLFSGLCVKPSAPPEKRFLHGAALYIFANMMVSGTSIFSIKTAGLLWVMAGYYFYRGSMNSVQEKVQ